MLEQRLECWKITHFVRSGNQAKKRSATPHLPPFKQSNMVNSSLKRPCWPSFVEEKHDSVSQSSLIHRAFDKIMCSQVSHNKLKIFSF
jgi:hypothetical protein